MPKISVLMNCFNGEAYLKEAIDSVYAQTFQDFEIIFWDNCSTDSSLEITLNYDSRLRYFKSEKTIPLYAARNLAMEKASGEIIAVLDVDDLWMPTKLEKQIPLFDNPKVGLVYSDTYFLKDGKVISQFFKNRSPKKGKVFEDLFTSNYFLSLETVMFRKVTLKDWDYVFDDCFNHIGDADLFRRIALNWEVDFVNEPLAYWRVHSKSLSWVHADGFHKETEKLIEKYLEIIPDFKNAHKRAYLLMKKEVAIGKAKKYIAEGEGLRATSLLFPYFPSLKPLVLGVMGLIPTVISKRILEGRSLV